MNYFCWSQWTYKGICIIFIRQCLRAGVVIRRWTRPTGVPGCKSMFPCQYLLYLSARCTVYGLCSGNSPLPLHWPSLTAVVLFTSSLNYRGIWCSCYWTCSLSRGRETDNSASWCRATIGYALSHVAEKLITVPAGVVLPRVKLIF
jgi:hypothetical protein